MAEQYWLVRISNGASFNYGIANNCFLMQYEYGKQKKSTVTQNLDCCKKVQAGDWLMLVNHNLIYAVGRACKPKHLPENKTGVINDEDSAVFYENLDESNGFNGEWGQRIDVEKWQYYLKDGISNDGITKAAIGGIARNTIFEIKKDYFDNKKCELQGKFMQTLGISEKCRRLLTETYNLILTGAPGTGKTYLAKQIAQRMIFGEAWTLKDENDFSEEERKQFKHQSSFVQFHPSYDYTDFVEGLRPTKTNENDNIGFELKAGVFKKFCEDALKLCKYDENGRFDAVNSPKFVFIIDEINRGEISKIFGELFFSIDPGYRGKKGMVETQYANMHVAEAGSKDYNKFFVPENVYIIGTMNDIDRSVESLDFAMRRRFVFKEITAAESAANMNLLENAKNRMTVLNEAISRIDGLNPSYHIGAAYFLKGGKPTDDFAELWNLRLEPLLKEYLRGTPDPIGKIDKLEAAFKLNPTVKNDPNN
ncbi:MAG: AAA family ATPase [Kiritimatiellae bacterium]|nr:AAA family ATPase [Kiritimatiellia bacterium]